MSHIQRKKSFNFEFMPPNLISYDFEFPYVHPSAVETSIAAYESKEEEFYLAETLALFDYMRKAEVGLCTIPIRRSRLFYLRGYVCTCRKKGIRGAGGRRSGEEASLPRDRPC